MSSPILGVILRGLDECVICHNTLDVSFPHNFPDIWKFCCACLECAEEITEGVTPRSDRFKMIYNKITLVGKINE